MAEILKNVVSFDIDRLFNGAIDVDWLVDGTGKAEKAASSFVFHGPTSHGISQKDIGDTSHRLVDTASFVQRVVDRIQDPSGNAFTLAIAGFGSGKSHLAVTLSELLTSGDADLRSKILDHIKEADAQIGLTVQKACRAIGRVLVVTMNGMNNSDLSSVLLSQIKAKVTADGLDASRLEDLRKRFKHAANLLQNLDEKIMPDLISACDAASKNEVVSRLMSFDEGAYKKAHKFLLDIGIPLSAVGDETAKDVINVAIKEFVGKGKFYSHFVILFDEFGHYMEYATSHPQIAGDGALQQLFEGVQGNDEKVTFVGFVQYELKAYAQRLPSEFKNEILRFITRFDNAEKLYLSSNLETLIASLLVKKVKPTIQASEAEKCRELICRWYPVAQNYSTWADAQMFERVIAEGCWPLAPLAMWVLFYLSSSGKYLQQRSALTLLKAALDQNGDRRTDSALPPVGLWTQDLQQEFEGIEEDSSHGMLMQSYNAVCAKFDAHFATAEREVLRSIVLMSQTQLRAENRGDAEFALEVFSGLDEATLHSTLRQLQDERNVIEWDNASQSYEILSDNASKPQFMQLLRKKGEEYDEERKNEIFCGLAPTVALLMPSSCDFANANRIVTTEWKYDAKPTYWTRFLLTINAIASELDKNTEYQTVETARGLMIFCYVPSEEDIEAVKTEASRILQRVAKKKPIIVIFIHDDASHVLSRSLVDLDILSKLGSDEKSKFGQLISAHEQKQRVVVDNSIRQALLERHYVTPFPDIAPKRLPMMEMELFEACFPKVLPFPFDGYATAKGNAAKDCAEFTRRLLASELSYSDTMTMGVAQRNRAQAVLHASWRVFSKSNGSVVQKPGNAVAKAIMLDWEKELSMPEGLNCAKAIKMACAAPYGANLASAGLLWGVFVQAFQNMLQAQFEGVAINLQTISQSAFTGNSLDLDYLKQITLYRTTGENGAWDQLISDWSACTTYREQSDFVDKIDNLESSLPMPPVLKFQVGAIRKSAKDAHDRIDAMEEKESDFLLKIENGVRAEKVTLIAFGASLLISHVRELGKDPMWSKEADIDPLIERVTEAKAHIAALFPDWLRRNQPQGSTQQALADFRRDSEDRMARNLKNLDMYDEKEQLLKHVERVSKSFEDIMRAHSTLSDFDTWRVQHGAIPEKTPVQQLSVWAKDCDRWKELLRAVVAVMRHIGNQHFVDELTARQDQLESIQKEIRNVRKKLDKRAEAVWKTELKVDSARKILDEVDDLTTLYLGEDKNLEDFRIMRNVLNAFLDIHARIESLQIPQDQFDILIAATRKEFVEKFAEEEPPWPLEESFNELLNEIQLKRRRASAEWMAQVKVRYAAVDKLSLQDAEAALRELTQVPPYFCVDKDSDARGVLVRKLEKHLESKGVEWLVEKFNRLSPSAKKTFLKQIKG